MKKSSLLLTALVLAAAAMPARAADLGVDAQIYSRPVAVVFRWTGIYIGAHAGGGFGKKEEGRVQFPGFPAGVIGAVGGPIAGFPVFAQPFNIGLSGWLAGGQIGANFQEGHWVWGVELQASASRLKGSSVCASSIPIVPPFTGSSTC